MIEFKKSKIEDIRDAAIKAQWEPYCESLVYCALKKRNKEFVERLYLVVKGPWKWTVGNPFPPHLEITYYRSSNEWSLQRPTARFKILLKHSVMESVYS